MNRLLKRTLIVLAAGFALHLGASDGVAQPAGPQPIRPPKAEEPQEVYPVGMYLVGSAAACEVIGISAMPSRRTHQD